MLIETKDTGYPLEKYLSMPYENRRGVVFVCKDRKAKRRVPFDCLFSERANAIRSALGFAPIKINSAGFRRRPGFRRRLPPPPPRVAASTTTPNKPMPASTPQFGKPETMLSCENHEAPTGPVGATVPATTGFADVVVPEKTFLIPLKIEVSAPAAWPATATSVPADAGGVGVGGGVSVPVMGAEVRSTTGEGT